MRGFGLREIEAAQSLIAAPPGYRAAPGISVIPAKAGIQYAAASLFDRNLRSP
jgi:hypothetical protein